MRNPNPKSEASRNLRKVGYDLLSFTDDARDDFHEPDEQGIRFVQAIGTRLDNAFGNAIIEDRIANDWQEVVIHLHRDPAKGGNPSEHFINLATLIALARLGAASILESKHDA